MSWKLEYPGAGGGGGPTTLAGDVTGPSGSNTVARLQGRQVSATAPSLNQVLAWGGGQWQPMDAGDAVPSAETHEWGTVYTIPTYQTLIVPSGPPVRFPLFNGANPDYIRMPSRFFMHCSAAPRLYITNYEGSPSQWSLANALPNGEGWMTFIYDQSVGMHHGQGGNITLYCIDEETATLVQCPVDEPLYIGSSGLAFSSSGRTWAQTKVPKYTLPGAREAAPVAREPVVGRRRGSRRRQQA